MHDVNESQQRYFNLCVRIAPRDNLPWQCPDEAFIESMYLPLQHDLQDKCLTLSTYVYDLRVAAQNLLAGDLFEKQVEPRKPPNPKYDAITLERYDELKKHFEQDTAWGKLKIATEEREATAERRASGMGRH